MKMFSLTDEQMIQVKEFEKNHECSIERDQFGHKNMGAIGGGLMFCFSPTSLGVLESVHCACGAKCDLTNTDDWGYDGNKGYECYGCPCIHYKIIYRETPLQ